MGQTKRRLSEILALLLVGAVGIMLGIVFQRNYGLGNTLRAAGLLTPFPTWTPIPPTPTPTPFGVPEEFQGKLLLFILAGQSNMAGYSQLPARQAINPRVFLFGNDYRWKLAAEPVDSALGQVDEVSEDGGAGFSPGLAFANAVLVQEPDLAIGLIPCAAGNTTIVQWQRDLSDTTLYGSCLKRVGAASPLGNIEGMLFFQGEADALDPEQNPNRALSAFDYAAKFSTFVTDFRGDLSLPKLPIVFAQIGSHTAPKAFTNWQVIQEQQATVKLPCTTMITTQDLPLSDGVHFTTESYQIIGERFAEAYLDLRSNQSCN